MMDHVKLDDTVGNLKHQRIQDKQLQAENKKLKALCLRESGVIREALKRKNNKSMLKVVADSLEEQALKGGE